MKRRMKAPSPALVIAVVALFVALGGTTYAATSLSANSVGTKQLKNNAVTGAKIKNGSVTTKKISKATVSGLEASAAGSVLAFDAPATASPTPTTLGTVLGDTWAAECALDSGHADLALFLKTTDGSWTYDLSQEINTPSADSFHRVFPAGSLSTSVNVGTEDGHAAPSDLELQDEGLQLTPEVGYLMLHLSVVDTTAPSHSCHMSIEAIPQKLSGRVALGHRPQGAVSSLRRLFGRR